jgi:C-terminal processing protease CtpA/Prc
MNYGFERVEYLEGNIGYIDLRMFAPLSEDAWQTMGSAIGLVANTDALIVDMRHNGGGSPGTIAAFSSYFFDHRTLLNTMYWREGDRTEEFWTYTEVVGRRYGEEKPIFVLTSSFTFSGAEEFCYNLQTRKRAVIVGEVTGGGAHPTRRYQLNETFGVMVPIGRAINPITRTNWEGGGIKPDVEVPGERALDEATRLAREKLK